MPYSGFKTPVTYNGKPILWDKHNIHGPIYMINQERLHLHLLSQTRAKLRLPEVKVSPAMAIAAAPLVALEWLRRRKNLLGGKK